MEVFNERQIPIGSDRKWRPMSPDKKKKDTKLQIFEK